VWPGCPRPPSPISAIGVDRVMFSVDYPYESMNEAVDWFTTCPRSHNDRAKIGWDNAKRFFSL
jgi:predicted TIM-barrel fold metal-dependent hydrolase